MLSAKVKDEIHCVLVEGSKQELWEFYDYWQEILWPNWKISGKMSEVVKSFDSAISSNQVLFNCNNKQFKDAMIKTLEYFKIGLELEL